MSAARSVLVRFHLAFAVAGGLAAAGALRGIGSERDLATLCVVWIPTAYAATGFAAACLAPGDSRRRTRFVLAWGFAAAAMGWTALATR